MNKTKLIFLYGIILSVLFSCSNVSNKELPKLQIDWGETLAENDLIWENMVSFYDTVPNDYKAPNDQKYHKGWDAGAFTGNGMIGNMIYKHDTQRIRFQLGRNDVTAKHHVSEIDWSIPRLKIGDFYLSPFGEVKNESMRMDLYNAEVRGKTITDKGEVQWRSFTHASEMIMIVEVTVTGDEKHTNLEFIPEWGRSPRTVYYSEEELKGIKFPPKPIVDESGEISTSVQKLTNEGEYAVAWTKEDKGEGRVVYYISIENSFPDETAKDKAVGHVKRGLEIGIEKLEVSHRNWWHEYYPQSFVSIPDEKWQQFYWIQMYKLASAAREDGPIIDNQGPWMTDTPWAGTWWNLNVQLAYSPLYASNRLSIAKSLSNDLFAHIDKLKNGLPDSLKVKDVAYIGRNTSRNYISDSKFFELGNLTWALHNVWREYKYGMDDELMTEKLYPLLKSSTNLYLELMKKGDDGFYHLPASHSPEYKQTLHVEDTNYALGLFRWALQTLIETNGRYNFNDVLELKWKDALKNLVPYQIDSIGLMIGKDTPLEISHRHYSHMIMFFPLHSMTGKTEEERDLITKSIDHWIGFKGALEGYSYTGASGMMAALGDGNKAYEYLNGLLPYCSFNTMYAEAGPVIETPLSAAESIHEMLLQSWGGSIRVFPAIPDNWKDIEFKNLRTEGAFLISAERKDGKTKWVKIESLAGEKLVLKHSIDKDFILEGSRDFEIKNLENNLVQIDIKKGEVVYLNRKK